MKAIIVEDGETVRGSQNTVDADIIVKDDNVAVKVYLERVGKVKGAIKKAEVVKDNQFVWKEWNDR